MPIIKSAIKRMHQAVNARLRNQKTKRSLKEAVKSFTADKSAKTLSKAQSELDKAVKKNLLKPNTAARRKSKLAAAAKSAGVKMQGSAKKSPAATKTAAKPATAKKAAPAKKPATKPTTARKKPAAKKDE